MCQGMATLIGDVMSAPPPPPPVSASQAVPPAPLACWAVPSVFARRVTLYNEVFGSLVRLLPVQDYFVAQAAFFFFFFFVLSTFSLSFLSSCLSFLLFSFFLSSTRSGTSLIMLLLLCNNCVFPCYRSLLGLLKTKGENGIFNVPNNLCTRRRSRHRRVSTNVFSEET